jgi:dipeptidase E
MKLLLISNSTTYGQGYFDHCASEVERFLGSVKRVLFIPYALHDRDGYAAKVRARFAQFGVAVDSIHDAANPADAAANADAFFTGGGNTFRLLNELYRAAVIEPIRSRVRDGAPYIGSSAGTNVATISIRTTNDMPIVQPPSFDALGLVPFNINPHYLDPSPGSTHMGETREERIAQFHEENTPPVVGLREGAWLNVDDARVVLGGTTGARLFRRGQQPEEFETGADLSFLLNA